MSSNRSIYPILIAQHSSKTNVKPFPKSKPLTNLKSRYLRSKPRAQNRQIRPPRTNLKKPGPKGKQPTSKGNSTAKPGTLFGGKNKGERCTSNQECFSTNCVFPGEKAGKQPKPRPKAKPNLYGSRSRSINSRANTTNPKNATKPNLKPVTGTCQAEIEQDPVPKSNFQYS